MIMVCNKIPLASVESSFSKSKKNEGICFPKKLFQNYPLDNRKQFWQTNQNFFAKNPICFPHSLKRSENFEDFVKKKSVSSKMTSGHKENSFDHHVKKIDKIPNVFHQSPLVSVKFLEQNDNVMPEDALSVCRKQFSKSGGTLCDGSPQRFSSKLEKIVKVIFFFRNQTFLEKSFVQVECTFDNFSKVFAPMLQIVLPTVGKKRRNSKNSYKKQFNQNSLSDT